MDNNQMSGHDHKMSRGMHWHCCLYPILGMITWIVGLLSVIYAWISISRGEAFWGLSAGEWFWSALTLGVLAFSGSRKKPGMCRCGSCGSGNCGGCSSEGGKCC